MGNTQITDASSGSKLKVNADGTISIGNGNANGQATMANSSPVVLASDQTNIKTKGDYTEVSGLTAASATNFVPPTDVSAYKWFSLQVNPTSWTGTLTFQCSNDGVIYYNFLVSGSTTITGFQATETGGGMYAGPLGFRYLKIPVTSYTAGSIAGTLELYTSPMPPNVVAAGIAQISNLACIPTSGTTGGSTLFHLISAASTNATSVKAAAGQVYGYDIGNSNAAIRYVKFYNKASAPTVGTDTPLKTILVPANGRAQGTFPVGAIFGIGIAIATTTGIADTDSNAVGASDLSIDFDYK